MNKILKTFLLICFCLTLFQQTNAALIGALAYGACQTGCNVGFAACLVPTGFVAGTFTLGAGIPAAVVGCCALQGTCMAACAALALNPVI